MTTDQMADIPFEGENPFETEEGDVTPTDSPTENNEDEEGASDDGAGKGHQNTDDNIPFHQHPRWKQREQEWQDRFNEQEQRHQEDVRSLREEFSAARKINAENTDIPKWFGGDQEQWDQFRQFNEESIKAAEERAVKRLSEQNNAEVKAVEEATKYMEAEIAAIENDKELNPTGEKIDPNKLVKIVIDNDLVDSKQRWNYRAGFRIMQRNNTARSTDRKVIAGATTSDQKGEGKQATFKTADSFKTNKPW